MNKKLVLLLALLMALTPFFNIDGDIFSDESEPGFEVSVDPEETDDVSDPVPVNEEEIEYFKPIIYDTTHRNEPGQWVQVPTEDDNRGISPRIAANTSTLLQINNIDQRIHYDSLFTFGGFIMEDNNSDGNVNGGDIYIPDAPVHIVYDEAQAKPIRVEMNITTNNNTVGNPGRFNRTIKNYDPNLGIVELRADYPGEFLTLGPQYVFLENNATTIALYGLPGVNDDNDGQTDEELFNGLDDDADGQIDEDVYMMLARGPSSWLATSELWHNTELRIKPDDAFGFNLDTERVTVGETLKMNGYVLDGDIPNTDMEGKVLEILFDNVVVGETAATTSGYYTFEYIVPESTMAGNHIITVRFRSGTNWSANQFYEDASFTSGPTDLRIYRPTKVVFTQAPDDRTCYRDKVYTINGSVLDAITNQPILFTIGNQSNFIYSINLDWDTRGRKGYRPIQDTLQAENDGNFSISLTIPRVQDVGLVNVSATFLSEELTTFYRGTTGYADPQYTVRVHTAITLWVDQDGDGIGNEYGDGHTNNMLDYITREPMSNWPREKLGSNVLIIYGVLWDQDLTTNVDEPMPISNQKVHLKWGATQEDLRVVGGEGGGKTTDGEGKFQFVINIDRSYELGPKIVESYFYQTGYYDGSQWKSTQPGNDKIFVIVSPVFFDLRSTKVVKGDNPVITGTLTDDIDSPVGNRSIDLFWKSTQFDDGFLINEVEGKHIPIITDKNGRFDFTNYTIPKTQPVGNAFVIAKFYGTPDNNNDNYPDYASKEAYLNRTSPDIIYNISANTVLQLSYSTDWDEKNPRPFTRDKSFSIRGQLLQTFQGKAQTPYPVSERSVRVYLSDGETEILLGTVVTNPEGQFLATYTVPQTLEKGTATLRLDFNGTIHYHTSVNLTKHSLWSNTVIDIISQPAYDPNDEDYDFIPDIKEDEMDRENSNYVEDLNYTFRIIEANTPEDEDLRPIPYPIVWLNISSTDSVFHNRTKLMGNSDGYVTFSFKSIIRDSDFPDSTIEYKEHLEVNVTYIGTPFSIPSSTSLEAEYEPPVVEVTESPFDWLYIIIPIIIFIALALILLYALVYLNRQRRIHEMKRIIRRAADQLIAGNEYTAVIFKSYQKLSAHLRKHGFLRREAETFREFEDAVRSALPIDTNAMDEFLDILEEARYSTHTIGENQRNKAINNLRNIETSLTSIIIDEDAALRALEKLEEEEYVETEVLVGADSPSGPPGPR